MPAPAVNQILLGLPGSMLGQLGNVTDARKTQAATAASEAVEDRAPNAPDAIKLEAAIQFAGYLIGSQSNVSERTVRDPSGTEMTVRHDGQATRSAMRYSRAGALLAPYVEHRAGIVG